jgi:ubiquinone biosynthesis protein UbiJ
VFAQPSVKTLNHLLTQNSWALPRLQKFAGKTARFNIAPFSFAYTILEDGLLLSADAESSADATCIIAPTLLPRLALQDENARSEIQSEGDAALLTEIFYLSQNIRWDVAEDLSKLTGDIAAERIVQTAKNTQQQLHNGAVNFAESLSEYWTEERPLITKPLQITTFTQQVDVLRDDIARLEQRVKALSPSPSPASGRGE